MVDLGADVRALLAQAHRVAQRHGKRPGTGHMMLAMLEAQGATADLLEAHGARAVPLYEALRDVEVEATNAVELSLERARRIAAQSGAPKARPLHLLLATLQNARSEGYRSLSALGVEVDDLRQTLEDSLGMPARPRIPDTKARVRAEALKPLPRTLIDWEAQKRSQAGSAPSRSTRLQRGPGAAASSRERALEPSEPVAAMPMRTLAKEELVLDAAAYPLLTSLGRNLTDEAVRGKLDPVVGREREVELVLDVLARRRANNPILVGPPGVGKTAIAEGLALRLLAESARGMAGKVLVELSAGSLVSGTGVRGALSEKLSRLRKEVRASEGRVLLFLDEIHAIVGAAEGPDELANELKAALSRGELPCVGATTEAEYRRVFERDAALARRFTRVEVAEPSREAALGILSGASRHYERFHGVAYGRDALEAAVDLSIRYLPEQHLPDKAIGLIDLAAARARRRGADAVDRAAIAAVVSEQAGVPVERLMMRDKEQLLGLEARLEGRVIGQRDAIARIADVVRKGAVGLRGARPLGVFLFAGPTGVGKTELAKALADELFTASGCTRLDMSEYSEPHAVARLFGAPPGYVGHEEGGQLTEAVRKKPYQLLLLDEIEKAHPDVLLAMLPLFDEGRLTDGRGRTVDFTNTIVVLTSNLGATASVRARGIGFESERAVSPGTSDGRALQAVRAALPPELFNRLDEVVTFPLLSRGDVTRIAERMLAGVVTAVRREHRVEIDIDDSVFDALIAAGGYDPDLGARPMRRVVGREVESMLAAMILRGEIAPGDHLELRGEGASVRAIRKPAAPHRARAEA